MAYEPGALDHTLAAAVGDDPILITELRDAFLSGAAGHLTALSRARDEEAWQDAAARLSGLAASFGAQDLLRLARRAAERPVADAVVLQAIAGTIERLEG